MSEDTSSYIQEKLQQSRPMIIGLGREGLATYRFIRKFLPDLKLQLADEKDLPELDKRWTDIVEQDQLVKFWQIKPDLDINTLGEELPSIIFKTPGMPTEKPFIKQLVDAGAELSANTSFCFELINQMPQKPITIGVTGTKGKSTTASLIYHVLATNGLPADLAGNIGIPPLTVLANLLEKITSNNLKADDLNKQIIVFELSSHQLRETQYSPHIAIIHDITPEHLDYYANFESYQKAKSGIVAHQKVEDVVIYNPSLAGAAEIVKSSLGRKLTFDINPQDPSQVTAYANLSTIFYLQQPVLDRNAIPLIGEHNLLNVLPVVIVGRELGLSNQQIAASILSFKPLPHRLEFVTKKKGVEYINDSQATTPEATLAALASFPNKAIHLIAGGSDKGLDLQPLVNAILRYHVRTVVLFPPTGEKIGQLLSQAVQNQDKPAPSVIHVSSMREAVNAASQAAKGDERLSSEQLGDHLDYDKPTGDVVLLSPACASFGIFENYIDRGDQFKQAVLS